MVKPPLPHDANDKEIWAASNKRLARFIFQYTASARTELAKVRVNARISNRLLWATWVLIAATVLLIVATLILVSQAT